MTSHELAALVLDDPLALWLIKSSHVRVLGPWVEARSERRLIGIGGDAVWRLTPRGQDVAVVHRWWERCDGVSKPNPNSYDDGREDEDYVKDLAAYKEATARRGGREWTWRVGDGRTEYASTKEEAVALADEWLRKKGYRLVDVLDAEQLRRYRA